MTRGDPPADSLESGENLRVWLPPIEERKVEPEAEAEIEATEFEGEVGYDQQTWVEEGERARDVDVDGAIILPGPCGDWRGDDELAWVDRSHAAISRGLCWPTRWFDGFFGNPDDEARASAGTYLSVIAGQRWREDGEDGSRLSYNLRVSLPGLERRLSLVFASEDEEGRDRLASDDEEEETAFRAGVRWAVATAENLDIDADATVTSSIRPVFRLRYRQRWSITEKWVFRFSETLVWRDPDGFYSRSRFDFSRPLMSRSALRFSTRFDWSEENVEEGIGWFWSQSASIATRIDRRSALLYQVSVRGYTEPDTDPSQYLASIRYRRNFWRPWLYYEIEPFVIWPREIDYATTRGIWLRLESRFGRY